MSWFLTNHPLIDDEVILKDIGINFSGKNDEITFSGDTSKIYIDKVKLSIIETGNNKSQEISSFGEITDKTNELIVTVTAQNIFSATVYDVTMFVKFYDENDRYLVRNSNYTWSIPKSYTYSFDIKCRINENNYMQYIRNASYVKFEVLVGHTQ